jgi:hypothetical protein
LNILSEAKDLSRRSAAPAISSCNLRRIMPQA